MPTASKRHKRKMPKGSAVLIQTRDATRPSGARDAATVTRRSARSFYWKIVDPLWREPKGKVVAKSGTATTRAMAEKMAELAWKAGRP